MLSINQLAWPVHLFRTKITISLKILINKESFWIRIKKNLKVKKLLRKAILKSCIKKRPYINFVEDSTVKHSHWKSIANKTNKGACLLQNYLKSNLTTPSHLEPDSTSSQFPTSSNQLQSPPVTPFSITNKKVDWSQYFSHYLMFKLSSVQMS